MVQGETNWGNRLWRIFISHKRAAGCTYIVLKKLGEIREFPALKELIKNGKITIGFDDIKEDNINWRQQSRVIEVWLIKNRG